MIIGHQTQWEFLKKIVENDKIPQAMIFSGQDSLGKKTVALEFIKLLNHGEIHTPDSVLIAPQGKEIYIGQIRDLQKSLSFRPQFADFKSVIIDQAHTLNKLAQNCFLKTLEEPKGRTLFLLITSLPEMLLETIRSRCGVLKFYPVESTQLKKHFKPEIIALSEGRPGIAFNFLRNPALFLQEKEKTEQIRQFLEKTLPEKFAFVEKLSKESSFQDLQGFLERLVRYLRSLFLQELSKEFKKKIELVEQIKFLLAGTNINQRLALEHLALNL